MKTFIEIATKDGDDYENYYECTNGTAEFTEIDERIPCTRIHFVDVANGLSETYLVWNEEPPATLEELHEYLDEREFSTYYEDIESFIEE